MAWRDKPYVCPRCGWQGMRPASPFLSDATCPECGELLERRSWNDTWGLTLLILVAVLAVILFVAYVPYWLN